jgi:hypothetical protein
MQPVQTMENGEFSSSISLRRGWNHIKVRALHPDFKEKVIWLSFFRQTFSTSAFSIGLRFDNTSSSEKLNNTFAHQFGKTFCLTPRLETELSIGLTRLRWQKFPGDYKIEATAIPFTASFHIMLTKGRVIPYLNTGITTYLTFSEKRTADPNGKVFFISPEIGGGLDFPFFDSRFRFEAIYSPFLKKEPFFPEMTNRLAFILKVMLNLRDK